MDLSEFEKILRRVWSKETSYFPDQWNEVCPTIGQCVPTALLVNDYFGSKIVWASVLQPDNEEISHYFNEIDGKEIDLTREQFPEGSQIPKGIEKRKNFSSTREYLLSNSDSIRRYQILKSKVEEELKKNPN